jgi:hypothetical protein
MFFPAPGSGSFQFIILFIGRKNERTAVLAVLADKDLPDDPPGCGKDLGAFTHRAVDHGSSNSI